MLDIVAICRLQASAVAVSVDFTAKRVIYEKDLILTTSTTLFYIFYYIRGHIATRDKFLKRYLMTVFSVMWSFWS